MAEYKVTLKTPEGEHEIECDEDLAIVDGSKTMVWIYHTLVEMEVVRYVQKLVRVL